jgi:ABC-type glycerol-3-phosphate transport system permease component
MTTTVAATRRTGAQRPAPAPGRAKHRIKRVLFWIPLLALIVWTLAPFLITVSISLKTPTEVFTNTGLVPERPTLDAFKDVLQRDSFRVSLMNSVIVGIGTTLLTLAVSVPAAYAFARFRFRGRHLLLLFTFLPRLIPGLGLMTPLYELAVTLGMIDKRLTLVVVYTGLLLPLAVWLLVGFFQQIPRELEEAAMVDGASMWRRLRFIVLPLTLPALITVGVLSFREAWNEFTLVLVLTTTPEKRTLPYELFLMQNATEGIPNFPAQAAFTLLTILPFIFVYTRIERYVVSGLTSGAVK